MVREKEVGRENKESDWKSEVRRHRKACVTWAGPAALASVFPSAPCEGVIKAREEEKRGAWEERLERRGEEGWEEGAGMEPLAWVRGWQ